MRLRLSFDVPTRRDLRVFAGYCLAAAVYIAIGVTWIDFLFSFWVGLAYLVVTAWAVPTLVRRRLTAAVTTGVAAALWGLLLFVTSPIAATPPVLAGLVAGRPRVAAAEALSRAARTPRPDTSPRPPRVRPRSR